MYLNGNLESEISTTGTPLTSNIGFALGSENDQPDYYFSYPFKGTIDDIRLYNRALSETEIQALYNEGH